MNPLYEILMTEEVDDYIASLDEHAMTNKEAKKQLKRLYYQLELLEQLGTRAPKKICRYLRDDLWELRPGDDRIIFFVWQNGTIVLLHKKVTEDACTGNPYSITKKTTMGKRFFITLKIYS